MTTRAVQVFDYNKQLLVCLTKHIKLFENEKHPSYNPVYNLSREKYDSLIGLLKR